HARRARPDRADEHDADRLRRADLAGERHAAARPRADRARPGHRAGAAQWRGVHRRPRAGRMADRHVDRPLRGGGGKRVTDAAFERGRRWTFAELAVFAAGVATLAAEIAAQRLIAPAFGASTVVWANTIAVVLLALAGGYW